MLSDVSPAPEPDPTAAPAPSPAAPPAGWRELRAGCFVRRYASYDLNVGVVAGAAGLLVVDTRADRAEGDRLRADLAELPGGAGRRPVRWVVNTHAHVDHCRGNAAFDGAEIIAHEAVPGLMDADGAPPAVPRPTRTFASVTVVDLGDRIVEVVHPGRGHTAGDAVVSVPDAGVCYAGDVVEESGPPAYGPDSFPLEWPASVDVCVGLLRSDALVVPGHGAVVDRDFARDQGHQIGAVADTVAELASRGIGVGDALGSAEWPFPAESLTDAVRLAYAHLPAGHGRLPLV